MRVIAAAICLLALILPAAAQRQSAETEIRAAFAQWTEDFNARRADKVCDPVREGPGVELSRRAGARL